MIAFDILQTARDYRTDLIVIGYAEDWPALVEEVELKAPCDVVFIGRPRLIGSPFTDGRKAGQC